MSSIQLGGTHQAYVCICIYISFEKLSWRLRKLKENRAKMFGRYSIPTSQTPSHIGVFQITKVFLEFVCFNRDEFQGRK